MRHRGRVVILTYHRVVSDEMLRQEVIQAGMYVRTTTFAAHLAYLREWFEVVSLDRLLDLWRGGEIDHAKRYCAITFDDGWRDNYQEAFPLLKKYGLPATIFLATDYVGTAQWFWPDQLMLLLEQARGSTCLSSRRAAALAVLLEIMELVPMPIDGVYRDLRSSEVLDHDGVIELCKLRDAGIVRKLIDRLSQAIEVALPTRRVLLNWDEVRDMAAQGVTFGSHSKSHRILTTIPAPDVRDEIAGSWDVIRRQGVNAIPVLCYPNGDYNSAIQTMAKEAGYLAATSCDPGLEGTAPGDAYALKRLSVHEDVTSSASLFGLMLSGLRA
jgi:peptidoglycan/xylan/chitin deacetylase (PgdA/CDA1 family)